MRPEHRYSNAESGPTGYAPQRKVGLETPLEGRFQAERQILVFAPPRWYDVLVAACFAFGVFCLVAAFFGGDWLSAIPFATAQTSTYWVLLGTAVMLSGGFAILAHDRLVCDLKRGTYARIVGRRFQVGSLDELDAVVLVAEANPPLKVGSVVYRLVLHWKQERRPMLVLGTSAHPMPVGAPLNAYAQSILARGLTYAQLLGVQFYDNSHFPSPCPIPLV